MDPSAPAPVPAPTPSNAGSWVRRPVGRGADGSASVEAVVLVPALVLVVLVAVQIGLWALASEAVGQVASRAATAAAALDGSATSGLRAGQGELEALAGRLVVDPTVTVGPAGPDLVQATAVGQVESVVPWLHLQVRAVRSAPRQGFHPWS